MHDLQLVGFTTDRRGLIFRPRAGARSDASFVVPVTADLVALVAEIAEEQAVEPVEVGPLAHPAEDAAAVEAAARPRSQMSVRDIQARLRAGEPVAQVAAEAGVDDDWIERFAPPIRAEQRRIVDRVLEQHLQRSRSAPSAFPLRRAVGMALAEKGIAYTVAAFEAAWSAHLLGHDRWAVEFTYRHRGRDRTVTWTYDAAADELTTSDRTAAQLGYVAPGKASSSGTDDGEAIDGIVGDPDATTQVGTANAGRRPRSRPAAAPSTAGGTAAPAKRSSRPAEATATRATSKSAASTGPRSGAVAKKAAPHQAVAKRAATKQQAAKQAAAKRAAAEKAPAQKAAAKKAAAKKAAAKKVAVEKAAAKKAAVRKAAAAKKAKAAERAAARKVAAREAAAARKAAVAEKTAASRAATAAKAAAKKQAAKVAAGKRAAAQKATAEQGAAREKAAAKEATARKKAAARKAAARKKGAAQKVAAREKATAKPAAAKEFAAKKGAAAPKKSAAKKPAPAKNAAAERATAERPTATESPTTKTAPVEEAVPQERATPTAAVDTSAKRTPAAEEPVAPRPATSSSPHVSEGQSAPRTGTAPAPELHAAAAGAPRPEPTPLTERPSVASPPATDGTAPARASAQPPTGAGQMAPSAAPRATRSSQDVPTDGRDRSRPAAHRLPDEPPRPGPTVRPQRGRGDLTPARPVAGRPGEVAIGDVPLASRPPASDGRQPNGDRPGSPLDDPELRRAARADPGVARRVLAGERSAPTVHFRSGSAAPVRSAAEAASDGAPRPRDRERPAPDRAPSNGAGATFTGRRRQLRAR